MKILEFFHCARCLEIKPDGTSPKDWARTQTGFTDVGFQVWCNRCDMNVAAFSFRGNKIAPDIVDGKKIIDPNEVH